MVASLCDNSKFVAFITKKFQIENYMPIMLYSEIIQNLDLFWPYGSLVVA